MPFVNVVFPLPRSPVNKTSTGAVSRFANSRPQFVVSSEECVMISSATFDVSHELGARNGDVSGNFVRQDARQVCQTAKGLSRGAMQIHAKRQDAMPVGGAELRGESGQDACEHVARPTLCQARVARGVDEEVSFGGGNESVKSFQHDMSIPLLRGGSSCA